MLTYILTYADLLVVYLLMSVSACVHMHLPMHSISFARHCGSSLLLHGEEISAVVHMMK